MITTAIVSGASRPTSTSSCAAPGGAADAPYTTGIVAALAQPIGVTVLLLVTRRRFPVRAPRGSYRAWTKAIRTALAATSGLYLVGTGLLARQFTPRPSFFDALADLLPAKRLVAAERADSRPARMAVVM